jgi:REase_MTES_1575/Protein of unknown function (DUF4011)/Protein of unknown function (DUF3320)/AAA domain
MSDLERTPEIDPRLTGRDRVLVQIEIWRKELVNLARSNRLLDYRETRASTLGIVAEDDEISTIIDRLLDGATWTFFMPPEEADRVEAEHELVPLGLLPTAGELLTDKPDQGSLTRALRNLDRRATQEYMDKGLWILYLAAGMLAWIDPDTEEVARSPLLLIPVSLQRENPREPYRLARVDEDIVVNPALMLKLQEFGLELPSPEDLDEPNVDGFLDDVATRIRSKRDWSVERRLVISHFSFHKEVMYRDLAAHAEEIADHPLIQALVLGAEEGSSTDFEPLEEKDLDEHGLPQHAATILPADATQRQCIDAAVRGNSFVMDGPPGTGKSQTIANMIAENIAVGRTVLFVSEKAAALEVVEKRLQQVGIGDYTIELHSHKATRKEVAHELARALTHHPHGKAGMPSAEIATLALRRAELSERAAAVNEAREPLGRTLHHALGRIAQLQELPQAPHPTAIDASLTAEQLAEVISASNRLAGAWGPIERGSDFLWRELGDIKLDAATQRRIGDEIHAASVALERLDQTGVDLASVLGLETPTSLPGFQRLHLVLLHLAEQPPVPRAWLTADDLESVRGLANTRRSQVEQCKTEIETLQTLAGDGFLDLPVDAQDAVRTALERLEESPVGSRVRDLRRTEIRDLVASIREAKVMVEEASAAAKVIAEAFGLPAVELTVDRAVELAELGALSVVPTRPEADWLSPAGVAAAQEARDVLRPLVDALKEQRAALGQTFTDEVLELDLDGLITRFDSVHRGLGKLRGSYRTDKRAVALVTRGGKASAELISLLPAAREWQQLARRLDAAEERYAGHLGEHYYKREDTDFELVDRALGIADKALELAGHSVSIEGLRRQLALGAKSNSDVHPTASWISDTFGAWKVTSSEALGADLASALQSLSLEDGIALLSDLGALIDGMSEAHERANGVAGRELTADELVRALSYRTQLDAHEGAIGETLSSDQAELGEAYQALETDWDDLEMRVTWAEELCELLDWSIDDETALRLETARLSPTELGEPLAAWKGARDTIASNFIESRREEVRRDLMTTVDDARQLLAELAESVGDIQEWFDYAHARERLVELGVREPVESCESEHVPRADLPRVIERAVLERWADAIIELDKGRIGPTRRQELENIIEEFRKLDQRVVDFATARVIKAANDRRPRTTLGPAGVITREGMKQRRHMPIRKLLETAGAVAQALKPCFLMTPLTVSQFLPPGFRFDVVIFDEASQVRPSDAVNCIYRGDQLIVAGDEQQLPPTSFFEVSMGEEGDDYEEDQFDEFESILKHCLGAGGLRQLPLRWHYRSHHEDLILYSNHSFYEGRLVSFPSAIHEAPDLGVALFHVPDGVYRRGTTRDNPREAQRVAERIMHWAEWSVAHPEREVTLGVVAFSEAQASTIEVELDRRRQERPDLDHYFREDRLDGYFIKNLENVQGDERDIMIFSVGYGRDENGKFTMNFGPLNRSGGKRRLNVAITRARRRVEVVSSVRAEEFAGDLSNEGVRHLQRYLDFAARGHPALSPEITDTALDAESPFEEEVIRVIRSWGFDAVPQVGAAGYRIDIGVRHPAEPGRYAVGVECDGAMYHSSQVARDRDRLRQEVLEGLGWRLHRIWGTAWYRDRARQEKALKAAIESAISPTSGEPPTRRMPSAPVWVEEVYEVVAPDERPDWAQPYTVSEPAPPSRYLDMHDRAAQAHLRRMIEEVVTVEGPVSRELVLRRVRQAWGVGRAGSRIREAFGAAVKTLTSRGVLVAPERDFLMIPDAEPVRVRIPTEDRATHRRIDEVPSTELRTAIECVVRDAIRVGRDELTQAVARLYGWNRRGSDIGPALDRAVTYLLRMKRLERQDDYLRLSSGPE